MEGSSYYKNVDNYSLLAKYYDSLLQDEESLSYWLEYIEEEPFETVLELASGSGVMAGILKRKGYSIIASDISKEMKEAAKANYDGEYLILDMSDFHLDRKFDLILCICDSINYLEADELDRMFKCVYEHLNDGGRFVFDMHSMKRIEEFRDEYIEEGHIEDVDYQWTILSDDVDNTLMEHFTFYCKDGMIQEHHLQHVFEPDMIIEKLKKQGFGVRYIDDFVEDEKVLLVGRK